MKKSQEFVKVQLHNMHLNKAKLNVQELAVIELFKTLVVKDRQGAMILENMLNARKETFGV